MGAATRPALVAIATLAAVAVSASNGTPAAAREPIVFGGRFVCPYVRAPERCGPGYNGAIFVMAWPGAPARRITDRQADDSRPTWSPDRRRIAFVRHEGATYRIWVMNADGSGARQITRGTIDTEPAWSPDGRWIAFRSGTRTFDVFVVHPDGTGLRNVTRNPAGIGATTPTWSPDGGRLAFRRSAPQVHGTGVYSIGLDGRGLRRLARAARDPDWSPNGHRIAYVAQDRAVGVGWQVFTVGVSGSAKRRISRAGTWAFPTWSPDSRRLVVAHDERRLAVMRLNGTVARWLTQRRPGFAIDGVDW